MTNLYVSASPVSPFVINIFDGEDRVHQEPCFLSDLADRVLILDQEYEVENNYIQGNKEYIEQIVKLFENLNFKIVE